MSLPRLVGNETAAGMISAAARGEVFHALIISGAEGSGRKTAAALLAASLMCRAEPQARPCGACSACRRISRGVHPDVTTVSKASDKSGYSVEQMRDMLADAYISPMEGPRKVYILPDAQAMSPQAQNAILKLLEEPPEYAVFMLITDSADRLLPTVRSRCAELAMQPVEAEAVRAWLNENRPDEEPDAIDFAVAGSCGLIGRAISLLGGADEQTLLALAIANAAAERSESGIFAACMELEKLSREELRQSIAAAACLVRDATAAKLALEKRLMPQYAAAASALAAALTLPRLAALSSAVGQSYQRSALYTTPGNLLAAMAAEIYQAIRH